MKTSMKSLCATIVASLALTALMAVPARASDITLDDTLSNDLVLVTWNNFIDMMMSCSSGTVNSGSGSMLCDESGPIVFQGFTTAHTGHQLFAANLYEGQVGHSPVSDTLDIQLQDDGFGDSIVRGVFWSDADPSGLTAVGAGYDPTCTFNSGSCVRNISELLGPGFDFDLNPNFNQPPLTVSVRSDVEPAAPEVPEPASLLLLGTGLAATVRRIRRKKIA